MAAEWWNPKGKFGVLHVFNPVRLQFITEQVTARLGRDPLERYPFEGPALSRHRLRRRPPDRADGQARRPRHRRRSFGKEHRTANVHREEMGLDIDYRVGTAEDLAAAGEQFDVVLNMEVIEHVADPGVFAATCARC